MLDLPAFLYGVLLPGLITGLGLASIWRPSIRRFPTPAVGPGPGASVYALFAGAAFFVSYSLTMELPPRPFASDRQLAGLDWLLWFALFAAPLFSWEGGHRSWLVRVPLAGFLLAFTLQAMVRHHWEGAEAPLWIGGLLAGLLLLQGICQRLSGELSRVSLPLLLLLIGTATAFTTGLHGSARLAQVAGMVCATLGAALLLGLWHEGFRMRGGDVSYAVMLLFGIGVCSFFFSDLPALDAGLLLSAPILAWLVAPRVKRLGETRGTLVVLAVAAAPLLVAGVRGYLTFVEASSSDYDYDY